MILGLVFKGVGVLESKGRIMGDGGVFRLKL